MFNKKKKRIIELLAEIRILNEEIRTWDKANCALHEKIDLLKAERGISVEERGAIEVLIKNVAGRGMDTQTYDALLTARKMLERGI